MDYSARPFLFDLYLKLRYEYQFALDDEQYADFLRVFLHQDNIVGDEEGLRLLCRSLWVPRLANLDTFNRVFTDYLETNKREFRHVFDRLNNKEEIDTSEGVEDKAGSIDGSDQNEAGNPDRKQPPVPEVEQQDQSVGQKEPAQNTPRQSDLGATEETADIYLIVKDSQERGWGASGTKDGARERNESGENEFNFVDKKILPFNTRKTTQALRKLPAPYKRETTSRLNIPGLLEQIVREGFVHSIPYESRWSTNPQIVWLSDHGGSMNPFSAWEEALLRIVTNTRGEFSFKNTTAGFNRYFFHDTPALLGEKNNNFRLFLNAAHSKASDWMNERHRYSWTRDTLVIFFSDGGAAHPRTDFARVNAFFAILQAIKNTTKRVLWINPVREIEDSAAQFISYFSDMVYPDDTSFQRLAAKLPPIPIRENDTTSSTNHTSIPLSDPGKLESREDLKQLDSLEQAVLRSFLEKYPAPGHWWMLCLSAYPVALSTDLMQQIWYNFSFDTSGNSYDIPLSTVDEVLHSSVIREMGYDLYERTVDLREFLLCSLSAETVARMGRFMKQYVEKRAAMIPTAALQEAEIINYKKDLLSGAEFSKEINNLLNRKYAQNDSSFWNVMRHIQYLLEVGKAKTRIAGDEGASSVLKELVAFTDAIDLAHKGDGAALRNFVNPDQSGKSGFRVPLPATIQRDLMNETKRSTERTPVILSYFAKGKTGLAGVSKEYRALQKIWRRANDTGADLPVIYVGQPYANVDDVILDINQYKDDIVLFHFAGNSTAHELIFDDESLDFERLSDLLGDLPNLKLIFLNGCYTNAFVDELAKKRVGVVIGCTDAVNDLQALNFSRQFYESLSKKGGTIKGAFGIAEAGFYIEGSYVEMNPAPQGSMEKDSGSKFHLSVRAGFEPLLDDTKWWAVSEEGFVAAIQPRPKLFALLVGIDDYQNGINKLRSGNQGINVMGSFLRGLHDFDVQIIELRDVQATRESVVQAFEIALSDARETDTVIFYFSGHDALVRTDVSWGSDHHIVNSIVCYGIPGRLDDSLLLDTELQYLLHCLYDKTRSRIVAVLDCSYYESGLRLGDKLDGRPLSRTWDEYIFGKVLEPAQLAGNRFHDLLPYGEYIRIYAGYETKTFEGNGISAFADAFISATAQRDSSLSYSRLVDRVNLLIEGQHDQRAVLLVEGNKKLASSRFLGSLDSRVNSPAFEAIFNKKRGWILNAGAIHGLKENMKVELHNGKYSEERHQAVMESVFADYSLLIVDKASQSEILFANLSGKVMQASFSVSFHYHESTLNHILNIHDFLETNVLEGIEWIIDSNKNTDYNLFYENGYLSITHSRDIFRPLFRPVFFNEKEGMKDIFNFLQHISKWHYILSLRSNTMSKQLPSSPLEIKLTQIKKGGIVEDLYMKDNEVKISVEDKNRERSAQINVEVINRSNHGIYLNVLYLSARFGSFLSFFGRNDVFLKAGERRDLRSGYSDSIVYIQDQLTEVYNFAERVGHLKFIVSEKCLNIDALTLDEIASDPLNILTQHRGLGEHKSKLDLDFYAIEDVKLIFENPLYDRLGYDVINRLLNDLETEFFTRRIYFPQIASRVYESKRVIVSDDKQKGRWGRKSEVDGYRLTAVVTGSDPSEVVISVSSPDDRDRQPFALFLHPTLKNEIEYLTFEHGYGQLTIPVYEAFTIGAYIADGTHLELDLQLLKGNPADFYYPVIGTVLWVNDRVNIDSEARRAIKKLTKEGVIIFEALDSSQASELLQNYSFDLVISEMSRSSDETVDLDFLINLRDAGIKTPTVVLGQSWENDVTRQKMLGLGAEEITSSSEADLVSQLRRYFNTGSVGWKSNGHTVLVVGTGWTSNLTDIEREMSVAIGGMLARKGFKLIGGGWRGVDQIVGETYTGELRSMNVSEKDYFTQVASQSPDLSAGTVIFVSESEWDDEVFTRAEAVIMIGGVGYTYMTFEQARDRKIPVIPLTFTGGDARKAYHYYAKTFSERYGSNDEVLKLYTQLDTSGLGVDQCAEIVASMLKLLLL